MLRQKIEKRRFYRHPLNIPVKFHEVTTHFFDRTSSVDLSEGGICFISNRFLSLGCYLSVSIPVSDQVFEIRGRVAYCNRVSSLDSFKVGVAFQDTSNAFRAKLAEQMLKIKEFQREISSSLGEEISEEEAARKWIEKHAKHFAYLF